MEEYFEFDKVDLRRLQNLVKTEPGDFKQTFYLLAALEAEKYFVMDETDEIYKQEVEDRPSEDPEDIAKEYQDVVDNVFAAKEKIDQLNDLLYDLAREMIDNGFRPDTTDYWTLVDSVWTGVYRSQTNPSAYAKGELLPYKETLESFGVKCKIECETNEYGNTYYSLYCKTHMWQAAIICKTITIGEAADCLASKTLHPQVVMPRAYNHPKVSDPEW